MSTVAVHFRGMKIDPSIDASVHRWVERLGFAGVQVDRCDVTLSEGPRAFEVEVRVALRGGPPIITRPDPSREHAHEDVYVAVADAFRAAWRQIRDRHAPAERAASRA